MKSSLTSSTYFYNYIKSMTNNCKLDEDAYIVERAKVYQSSINLEE